MKTDGTLIHYQQHINGQFVPAVSGKTIQSMNPSLGMPWATIPDSNQDDANLAISAAREAFDNGPWGKI
jgi:aldehyde dehydrogenase (NAD+)